MGSSQWPRYSRAVDVAAEIGARRCLACGPGAPLCPAPSAGRPRAARPLGTPSRLSPFGVRNPSISLVESRRICLPSRANRKPRSFATPSAPPSASAAMPRHMALSRAGPACSCCCPAHRCIVIVNVHPIQQNLGVHTQLISRQVEAARALPMGWPAQLRYLTSVRSKQVAVAPTRQEASSVASEDGRGSRKGGGSGVIATLGKGQGRRGGMGQASAWPSSAAGMAAGGSVEWAQTSVQEMSGAAPLCNWSCSGGVHAQGGAVKTMLVRAQQLHVNSRCKCSGNRTGVADAGVPPLLHEMRSPPAGQAGMLTRPPAGCPPISSTRSPCCCSSCQPPGTACRLANYPARSQCGSCRPTTCSGADWTGWSAARRQLDCRPGCRPG